MQSRCESVLCKVCDKGNLLARKKYRMSGPVVAIGYLLLVPSVFGIIISLIIIGNSSTAGTHSHMSAFLAGFALLFGIGSFIGGLLGWLLVMKKNILQCHQCGAVVNAS